MSSGAGIDALVVDLAGVAAAFRPEARSQALAGLTGLDEAVIQQRLFDSGLDLRAEMGVHTADEAVAEVLAALDHRLSADQIIDAWALAFDPNLMLLDRLAALKVHRVLFTNNGPLLDACVGGPLRSLASAFDDVICSWHLGVLKPQVAAFKRAATRLRCEPGRLLLLDDSPENVASARSMGWLAECVSSGEAVVGAIDRHFGVQPK